MLKQHGQSLAAALNARLERAAGAIAVVEPPPLTLKIQQTLALPVAMQTSIVISVALHAMLVLGVGIHIVDPKSILPPHDVLDVVLVNSKTVARPSRADMLAQANLDGGGNTEEKRRAKSPLPNLEQRAHKSEFNATQERVRRIEQEVQQLMTQARAQTRVMQGDVSVQPSEALRAQATADLLQKSFEIARLEAQIAREYDAYQQRPRRNFIGARAAEYRFAQYIDSWRLKIERIGNLNYPAEAKTRKIYGSLQMTVAIKANGEVEEVQINRSSGHKVLDRAAKRIVRLAAPFDAFPDNIRRDTDILHITRTWSFTRDDLLFAE